jgi:AcrR family transcriptional regulator
MSRSTRPGREPSPPRTRGQASPRGKGKAPTGAAGSDETTTRVRVLGVAARVFAERGYRAATMDEIAAESGLSKGGLYWNFASKEELFMALLDQRLDRRIEEMFDLVRTTPADEESAVPISRKLTDLLEHQRDVMLLFFEFWQVAARDPAMRKRFNQRQRRLRVELAEALRMRYELLGTPMTLPAEQLARAILSLAEGISMERLVDPKGVPDDLLRETLNLIYDGIKSRAEGR